MQQARPGIHRIVLQKDENQQYTYSLDGRVLHDGDIVEAYFERGGWVAGRYFWSGRVEFTPRLDPVNPTHDRVRSSLHGFNLSTACRWPVQIEISKLVQWSKKFDQTGSLLIEAELEAHVIEIRGPYQGVWRVTLGLMAARLMRSFRSWPSFEVRGTLDDAKRAAIEGVLHTRRA